jgi:hypothetical protein
MVWVLYGNVHPYPPSPLRWFIYATIGVIAVSVGVAYWIGSRKPDAMLRAGRLMADIEIEEDAALGGPAASPHRTPGDPGSAMAGGA